MKSYRERTEDILEKAAAVKRRQRARNKKLAAGISCSLAAVLVLNFALFLPRGAEKLPPNGTSGTDIPETAESYAEVQERLRSAFSNLPSAGDDKTEGDGQWENNTSADSDREIADRADGVVEGDILKRGKKTAFYLTAGFRLQVYPIGTSDTSPLGEIAIVPGGEYGFFNNMREMYLNEDLSAATVLSTVYSPPEKLFYTAVITVETKNPAAMSVTGVQYISGKYVSSRMVEGKLLVVSEFAVSSDAALGNERLYIPQTGTLGAMASIPASDIFLPETAKQPVYTVVTSLSGDGERLDTRALLSFSDDVYVSGHALYATCGYLADSGDSSEREGAGHASARHYEYRTDVVRIEFNGNGKLILAARTAVEGQIGDRFSMDEYKETLRVFATTGGAHAGEGANASLYVYNAETLELIACIGNFASGGEKVRSARFDGDAAYVCTAADLNAPVFKFDLSDLDRITYTDSGGIAGYSTALTKFTGGLLLGIWHKRSTDELRIGFYDENIRPVASYSGGDLGNCSEDYKAYYLGREFGLIGFAAADYSDGASNKYILLRLNGTELTEAARVKISCGPDNARAFYEDGVLYIFDGDMHTIAV